MIKIFTDGACSGNPGPGGWAAIILMDNKKQVLKGGAADTTNNRMELLGPIHALESLAAGKTISIYADSKYVVRGMNEWIDRWRQNNWCNAQKKPVKNQDLWRRLAALSERHTIHWEWVKGHTGLKENEEADSIARNELELYRDSTREPR